VGVVDKRALAPASVGSVAGEALARVVPAEASVAGAAALAAAVLRGVGSALIEGGEAVRRRLV